MGKVQFDKNSASRCKLAADTGMTVDPCTNTVSKLFKLGGCTWIKMFLKSSIASFFDGLLASDLKKSI